MNLNLLAFLWSIFHRSHFKIGASYPVPCQLSAWAATSLVASLARRSDLPIDPFIAALSFLVADITPDTPLDAPSYAFPTHHFTGVTTHH